MPHSKLRPSFTFDEERINELKKITPEAFADGKINWDTLKDALGDYLEDSDEAMESFGLFWPGKKQSRKHASVPSKGTLVPVEGDGFDEENTRNIFIEGENLEVLKILQKSYAGRVKIIYIDPPYNTGNDLIYEDDFKEPLQEYLKRTGQIDEEGRPMTTNTRADGRFHSKWLSMMYPRLRLARNLLTKDGVILISIDDNEFHNLRQVMNELFGEENFVGVLVWEKKKKGAFLSLDITNIKEYILVYSKSKEFFKGLIGEIARQEETYPVIKTTNPRGIRIIPKGIPSKYREKNHTVKANTRLTNGNMEMILLSDLKIRNGILIEDVKIDSNWIYSQNLIDEYSENNELYITQDLYFRRIVKDPREKKLKDILPRVGENDESGSKFYFSENLFSDGWGTNEDGNMELHDLMGIQNLFDFPKPSKLLAKLFSSIKDNNCIILDFFAGSGTTSHAILELNNQDTGQRKYILVQMPEKTDEKSEAFKAGYKTISEIAKERIRRVIKKINESKKKEGLDFKGNNKINDLGFKLLKLVKSNFNEWKDYNGENIKELETLFDNSSDPLVFGWKEKNVLTEILLIEGFPLDSIIEINNNIKSNKIYIVKSDFHEHKLLISLDKEIKKETIDNIIFEENDIFICLDSAITDKDKVNLSDKGFLKTI